MLSRRLTATVGLAALLTACTGDTDTDSRDVGHDGAASEDTGVFDASSDMADVGEETCELAGELTPVSCDDLIRLGQSDWSWTTSDNANAEMTLVTNEVTGGTALRVDTESSSTLTLRYEPADFPDYSEKDVLHFAIRAYNDHSNWGWSKDTPTLRLIDETGAERTIESIRRRLPKDGVMWHRIQLPLREANGWLVTEEGDAPFQLQNAVALEIEMRTRGPGFWVELDFGGATNEGETCEVECAGECSGRGSCVPELMRCRCARGATGNHCESCAKGYEEESGECVLVDDGDHSEWPNASAPANSAPWLVAHHADVEVLRPKVLILNFANPVEPTEAEQLMQSEFDATAQASRYRGFEEPSAPARLEYELVDIIDLRDGVEGRPEAPADWPFETSTLFPRRAEGEPGNWGVDYAAFYGETFAEHYGFEDPDEPGQFLQLCDLFERGLIHELWFLQRPHPDDVNRAEVLEFKQRYTQERNPIPGSFDRCAGNGCFDQDVPVCDVTARIVSKNYRRGTGCRLHTVGHNLERMTVSDTVPALTAWFETYSGFDLDRRYGLPFRSLYQVACDDKPCIEYPTPDRVEMSHRGENLAVDDWDPICGNVHFPPNARRDYEADHTALVSTSCAAYGHVERCEVPDVDTVSTETWDALEVVDNDCAGRFNAWWFQQMPNHDSGHRFRDGRPMLPLWPFLYY